MTEMYDTTAKIYIDMITEMTILNRHAVGSMDQEYSNSLYANKAKELKLSFNKDSKVYEKAL